MAKIAKLGDLGNEPVRKRSSRDCVDGGEWRSVLGYATMKEDAKPPMPNQRGFQLVKRIKKKFVS